MSLSQPPEARTTALHGPSAQRGPAPASPTSPASPASPASLDPTRTGTLWLGIAGVALILAAAAVLVAVNWDDIGEWARLGGLALVTVGLLDGGRRLERILPVTGSVIHHLGAFLIPFVVAAVSIVGGGGWEATLLAGSIAATVAWVALGAARPSIALTWATRLAIVGASAGVAAVSPVSWPLVLAVVGAGAFATRFDDEGEAWLVAAAVLPLGAMVEWPSRIVTAQPDLGMTDGDRWSMVVSGVVASAGLLLNATRRRRIDRAWLSVLAPAVTAVVVSASFPGDGAPILAAALAFAIIELHGLFTRHDPLWKPITELLVPLAELVGAGLVLVLVGTSWLVTGDPVFAATAAAMTVGWLTADRRRLQEPVDWAVGLIYGSDWPWATLFVPISVVTGVAIGTESKAATAAAWLVVGAWAVLTGRRWAPAVAGCAGLVVAAMFSGTAGLAWSAGATAGLIAAAVVAMRSGKADTTTATTVATALCATAAAGKIPAVAGDWSLAIATIAIFAVGALLDGLARTVGRGEVTAPDVGSLLARALAGSFLLVGWTEAPAVLLAAWAGIALVAGGEAMITGRRELAWVAVTAGAVALRPALHLLIDLTEIDLTAAWIGVILMLVGSALLVVTAVVPQRHEMAVGIGALVLHLVGAADAVGGISAETYATLAPALLIAASSLAIIAAMTRSLGLGLGAAALASIGVAVQLDRWSVEWLEAWLALPALTVLVVGLHLRDSLSSWMLATPPFAALGLIGLLERAAGGSAWRSVIAGGLGVTALLIGARFHLVGPLVTGPVVLALVVLREGLGTADLVPVWAWLAVGGAVLLGGAVALERTETSPLEQGQRMLDVLQTHYR